MKKIAIIGGGIGGLTAAYLLNPSYDITLFEKENRLGGNAYTLQTNTGETLDIAVGSVLDRVACNFLKLLNDLNVPMVRQPKASLLSIHDLETGEGFYPTFLSLKGLFAQNFSLLRSAPSFIKIPFFNHKAVNLLDEGKLEGLSVENMFSLLPPLSKFETLIVMAPFCLLSSMCYKEVLKGPAEYFVGKMKAHGKFNPLLTLLGNYFPKNFTRSYIDALTSRFQDKVVLNANIATVIRDKERVQIKMTGGETSVYDKVVFACNADQALSLLDDPTPDEKRLLGAWKYKEVPMVVHRDDKNAPKRALCQPWTCIQSPQNGSPHFSISYCTWLLSPAVSKKSPFFSTQYANFPIRENLIDTQKMFRVPFYDFDSFKTLKDLPSLNGKMNSYYCGSHFGYGLHGDAVNSAVNVARHLGIIWGNG